MKIFATILALSIIALASGACTTWMNQTYDNTTDSLDNGTPLGYARLTIPNPELMLADPCITITASRDNQYVEVNIQTTQFGSSRICVTVNNDVEAACGNGIASYCKRVPAISMTAKFFCDDSCDLSDTEIYYRVTLSAPVDIDDEYWCDNRPGDYPSNLLIRTTPGEITQPPIHVGAGYTISLSLPLFLALLITLFGLHHLFRV